MMVSQRRMKEIDRDVRAIVERAYAETQQRSRELNADAEARVVKSIQKAKGEREAQERLLAAARGPWWLPWMYYALGFSSGIYVASVLFT